MSELLAAAAQALGVPESLVKRSAEARAKASGVGPEEVLAAWAGGGAVAVASVPAAVQPTAPATAAVVAEVAAAAPVVMAVTPAVMVEAPVAEEPHEIVDPVPLRRRIQLAGRIGAWTGVILGVVGVLVSAPWLLPAASIMGTEGDFSAALLVDRGRLTLVTALLSVGFGAIVAGASRTLAGWLSPGAALVGRHGTTTAAGGTAGLVLGLGAAAGLASFGEAVEGTETMIQIPVASAMVVVLIGGALLGWLVAALVQAVGVPVAVGDHEADEVQKVRSRLQGAIAVPLAGLAALALLVLPFAIVLIRSNHMATGGAAVLAILTAGSILAVAGVSASRPGMKISRGEFLVALGGIGLVVMIIVAVFLARSEGEHSEEPSAGETAATAAEA